MLEAAQRNNVELPHLCHTGACGACAARVLEGDFDQEDALLIDEDQAAMGFTLLCCARPRSNMKLVSHQEGAMHTLPYHL